MADSCEHGNEPSGSVTARNFWNGLGDYQLLKNVSAP
jgi:hypothetical protein